MKPDQNKGLCHSSLPRALKCHKSYHVYGTSELHVWPVVHGQRYLSPEHVHFSSELAPTDLLTTCATNVWAEGLLCCRRPEQSSLLQQMAWWSLINDCRAFLIIHM